LKKILLLFFCFISNYLFAQSDSTQHKNRKWSAGVILYPQFTDRTDYEVELFVPRFGYSAGMNVMYQMTGNFYLETGLLFSKKGWDFTWDNVTFGDMIDPRYGFTYATQTALPSIGYEIQSMEIPVKFNWIPGKGKIRFIGGAGCITSFNLSVYKIIGTNEHIPLNNNITEVGMSITIHGGLVYFINHHFSIRMQPEFQYSLFEPAEIFSDYHLMTLGVNTNFSYKF
jgi:hypothetical protein